MSEHDRGCVKGVVLTSRLAFVRARGGEEALERVLARLPEHHRTPLVEILLPMTWYPFELNEALDRAIVETFGGGETFCRSMGAQSADDSLGGAHKNLVRSRTPQQLLEHAAQIHRLYYDSGYRTYERLGGNKARLRTFDCKSFSAEDCQTNLGWHQRAIEICGGHSPRVTDPKCRARGDEYCEYLCEWA